MPHCVDRAQVDAPDVDRAAGRGLQVDRQGAAGRIVAVVHHRHHHEPSPAALHRDLATEQDWLALIRQNSPQLHSAVIEFAHRVIGLVIDHQRVMVCSSLKFQRLGPDVSLVA